MGETLGDTSVKEGSLQCGDWQINVKLTDAELTWSPSTENQRRKSPSKKHMRVTTGIIKLDDVIAVTRNPGDFRFTMHSVVRKPKNIFIVQKKVFDCPREIERLDDWTGSIQSNLTKLPSQRPHRLLIIINPQAGKKKAQQYYKQHAVPLFQLAGIETDVILTERKLHATELLQQYDLSSVDGVVSIGGDGTFKECVNGLILRGMKDAGRSTTDPATPLLTADVKLTAMPGGTGNGIANMLFGTLDFRTAALRIILGHCEKKLDIGAMFSGGQSLGYTFLFLALGTCSDLIYEAETNRRFSFLGPLRFAIPAVKTFFNRQPIDVEIEWMGPQDQESNVLNAADVQEVPVDACAQATSLQSVSGRFMDVIVFPFKIHDGMDVTHGKWNLYLIKPCGKMKHASIYSQMARRNLSLAGVEHVQHAEMVEQFTMRITGGGVVRDGDQYTLIFDGEVVMLPQPEFSVRICKEVISCFGAAFEKV